MTRLRARHETTVKPPDVPEGSVVTVFRVPPEMAGMRVDRFITSHLKRTSRTRAQEIIRASAYASDGRRLRVGDRVMPEQRILLWRSPWDETPVPTELPVLYEDAHFVAVHKPAGLPVHPTARYYKNTVTKLLEEQRGGEWLSLAHRLDRETSGVLLLSRTSEADRAIKKALLRRAGFDKRYVALTWGAPKAEVFRVELPLEIDPTSKTKVKMRVAAAGEGLASATAFRVLGVRWREAREYALVRCDLETGRQHQIRVHLASGGTPVVGDKLYALDEGFFTRHADAVDTAEDRETLELPRHALHAQRLAFDHPFGGARVEIEAPLPADIAALWEALTPV